MLIPQLERDRITDHLLFTVLSQPQWSFLQLFHYYWPDLWLLPFDPSPSGCLGICRSSYLLQLLLGIFLAAPLILRSLPQLLQPLGFLLGKVDLIAQLLLQVHLFHLHCAVLLLGFVQPADNAGSWRRPGKAVPANLPRGTASKRKMKPPALRICSPYSATCLALMRQLRTNRNHVITLLIWTIILLPVTKAVKPRFRGIWILPSKVSWRQWRTREPGVLHSMGSQRVRHNLLTEQQQDVSHTQIITTTSLQGLSHLSSLQIVIYHTIISLGQVWTQRLRKGNKQQTKLRPEF